ncbi:hypothetical protein [Labedaea rhizosphaerae]|uniref:Uncharacterized protein n=1 Tax=Labedaea rhizosphaerae TaxID=598644 RepID=A0A4R6RVS0_LABRH|nr:hypothetical protein [Labedaea rhizosphaerae]TDP90527.1 hypothetical protein EV186_11067 [Labedaea rhizosphaerae]
MKQIIVRGGRPIAPQPFPVRPVVVAPRRDQFGAIVVRQLGGPR